ncbi:MAG: TPM domain-containing protein, partial [Pyrinomonadaceae bacterium]
MEARTVLGDELNKRTHLKALLLVLFATLTCVGADVPRPMPGTFVHDFAGVIPDEKRAEIQAKAQRLKDEYKTEIAVVTIESLQGEESFDYSMRMARSWGIGSKDNDVRGLLILVAVKDRKTAFRTSRHIEGELPDSVTGDINRQMNAYFKRGDFGGGLSFGMDLIIDRLKAAYEPQPVAARAISSGSNQSWPWLPVTGIVVGITASGLGYVLLRRRGRKRREAGGARQAAAASSFRAWAAAKDPSTAPKANYQGQGSKRKDSHTARGEEKGSTKRSVGSAPSYGDES